MTGHEATTPAAKDEESVREGAWHDFWETVGTAFASLPAEVQARCAEQQESTDQRVA